VLRLTVESFDEMQEDTLDAAEDTSDGEESPAVVSFSTVAELWNILTPLRIELLRALIMTTGAAESLSTLAESLNRSPRTVHDDVSLLADYGLVFIVEEGQSKRPYLPYERVHLDVELAGGRPDEDTDLG
jgi:predicted transcriptional regulator